MDLSADRLVVGCADDALGAGIVICGELEPLGGPGSPVKPAVYEGRRYQTDKRWAGDGEARTPVHVIVSSVLPETVQAARIAYSS